MRPPGSCTTGPAEWRSSTSPTSRPSPPSPTSAATPRPSRGDASAQVRQSFDDAARELSAEVRTHLQANHLRGAAQRWHFQRRDGAIADELIAVADELRRRRGPETTVVIVVGRSEHGYHHVLGSVPQALERHDHFPVMVIP